MSAKFLRLLAGLLLVACRSPAPEGAGAAGEVSVSPSHAPPSSEVATPDGPPAVAIVEAIHSQQRSATYATFGEKFRAAVPFDEFDARSRAIDDRGGPLVEARVASTASGGSVTRWTVVAFFERQAYVYTVSLDSSGVVRGLRRRPLLNDDEDEPKGPGPADDYVAKRAYALPLRGTWHVVQGGPTIATNGHVGNRQQWYALDLFQRGADGKSYRTDGKTNDDHLAYGQPVLAPADGVVAIAVDGVPDNVPGEKNAYIVPGNVVILEHGDGEFSVLAHLRPGSIKVQVGSRVKAGDIIGAVGNSGNSSEPHLHWHLQSSADMSAAHGLPIKLAPLKINGTSSESPRPVRDDALERWIR